MTSLSRTELARYLGYGDKPLDEDAMAIADQCEAELFRLISPRRLGRRMLRERVPFMSADLDRHLKGCREVFLTAVMLGSEADRLQRKWSAQSMGKAVVGQALQSVYVDHCCDVYLAELETKLYDGEYLLPAYSPGYGDFSLQWQGELLRLLDAPRRMGLLMTDAGMLVPEKSVTAVVGITDVPTRRCIQRCHLCQMETCNFRKGG